MDMKSSVTHVENLLDYRFKNKTLLEEALTHPSYTGATSYQRLEFVGDAALGLAISNFVFLAYPELDPGQLSLLRSANVSTEKLARVAVRHGLYGYVRHNASPLGDKVRDFVIAVQEEVGTEFYGGSVKAPKVLADIVASVAAALYVDCNFDIQKLWMHFRVLLEPIITPDMMRQQPQPVTLLFELCQREGKDVHIHHWRNGERNIASVYVDGEFIVSGSPELKEGAKLQAAKAALQQLSFSSANDRMSLEICTELNGRNEIEGAKQKLHEFGLDGSSADTSLALGQRDKVSHIGSQTSGQRSTGSISKQEPFPAHKDISSDIRNLKLVQNSPGSVAHNSKQLDGMSTSGSKFKKDFGQSHPTEKHPNVRKTQRWQISGGGSAIHSSVNVASKSVIDTAHLKDDETSLPVLNAVTEMLSKKETKLSQTSNEKTGSPGISENYDGLSVRGGPFEIARLKDDKTSLPVLNAVPEMPSKEETELSQTSNEKTGSPGISENYVGPSVKDGPFEIAHLKDDETSLPVLNAVTEMLSKKETKLSQTSNEKTGTPGISENYDGPSVKEGPFDIARLKDDETSLPVLNAVTEMPSTKETELSQTSNEKTGSPGKSKNYDGPSVKGGPFDIYQEQTRNLVKQKAPLLVKNREKIKEISCAVEGFKISILRSGMILLKNYISLADQVKIVKTCREIGLGKGGFYQPGYRNGAELHLKMMCLGKNWDPETSSYVELRPFDHARPPAVPNEFHQLVKGAIQDSHKYLQKQNTERNVEYILPSMSPNLCIVKFYSNSGRLGLHQDKDESQRSIGRKLPVVSFSIGDSAEFLYGDERDIKKAEKLILESGDVLIYGGKSRLIFHGVRKILRDTAPKALQEELNLRPGRLNLSFREY